MKNSQTLSESQGLGEELSERNQSREKADGSIDLAASLEQKVFSRSSEGDVVIVNIGERSLVSGLSDAESGPNNDSKEGLYEKKRDIEQRLSVTKGELKDIDALIFEKQEAVSNVRGFFSRVKVGFGNTGEELEILGEKRKALEELAEELQRQLTDLKHVDSKNEQLPPHESLPHRAISSANIHVSRSIFPTPSDALLSAAEPVTPLSETEEPSEPEVHNNVEAVLHPNEWHSSQAARLVDYFAGKDDVPEGMILLSQILTSEIPLQAMIAGGTDFPLEQVERVRHFIDAAVELLPSEDIERVVSYGEREPFQRTVAEVIILADRRGKLDELTSRLLVLKEVA